MTYYDGITINIIPARYRGYANTLLMNAYYYVIRPAGCLINDAAAER